jgi:hypothetical protein
MAEEHDPLAARMAKRTAKLARQKALRPAGIRVEPRDEDMRRVLKSSKGVAFRSSGSAEWPNDRFTQRRIADGSVRVVTEDKSRGEQRREDRREQRSAS